MDVRDHTTASNSCLDKSVELLVYTDSQLKVAGSDAVDFKVVAGVASKFQDLSSEVFKDCGRIDSCCGAHSAAGIKPLLKVSVDATNGELRSN